MKPPVLARATYADYKKRLELKILPAMGHVKIGNIRQKTINDYRKVSYAVTQGLPDLNMLLYSGKVTGRKKPRKEATPQYFTVEELIRFIDALETPINVPQRMNIRCFLTGFFGQKDKPSELLQLFQKI